MDDFGQSRVGQPAGFGRQGGAQAAVLRPHQGFQADHAGNAAPGTAEAPGEGVENFILRRAGGDEGEDEIYLVLSGSGLIQEGGKWVPIRTGDAILTGKGGTHGVENNGTEPLVIAAVIILY